MQRRNSFRIVSLFLLVVAFLFAIAPAAAYAASKPFTPSDIYLYDIDGSLTTMSSRYGGTKRVIIVGHPGCGNTQGEVQQSLQLSNQAGYENVNFIVLDILAYRDFFINGYGDIKGFKNYETDRVRFYSIDSSVTNSSVYDNWASDCLYKYSGTVAELLPITLLMNENNQVVFAGSGYLDIDSLCTDYLGVVNPNLVSLDVEGYISTQAGMQLLKLVNEARAAVGAKALVWDATLAQTAIQRAFEIGVLYSHMRPNGADCITAWPSEWMAAGENIAMGQMSVAEVNNDWTNSPGHYANMVEPEFESFAAAMYVGSDGIPHWVECFAAGLGSHPQSTGVAAQMTGTVSANVDFVYLALPWQFDTYFLTGHSKQLPAPTVGNADLVNAEFEWTSSDPTVLSVTPDGVATGVSEGTAILTFTLKSDPRVSGYEEIWVSQDYGAGIDIGGATITLENTYYSGTAHKPGLTVYLDGEQLYEGWDYFASYSNNVNAGTATVTIYGEGDYVGTATTTFEIRPFDISDATVGAIANQAYTGNELKPSVSVKVGELALVAGRDFTVTYKDNVEMGIASATIEGQGNFTGSKTVTFNIVAHAAGWAEENGWWYYYDANGNHKTDHWASYGGKWYYFGDDGALVWTGVCKYQGKYYYVKSGAVQTTKSGWKQVGNDWYYFNGANGAAYQNQWYKYGSSYYYLGADGKLVVNDWITYQGKQYHFNAKGVCDDVA